MRKKRKPYKRRRLGETSAHDKRRPKRKPVQINCPEMNAACDKRLEKAGIPTNRGVAEAAHLELYEIKVSIVVDYLYGCEKYSAMKKELMAGARVKAIDLERMVADEVLTKKKDGKMVIYTVK